MRRRLIFAALAGLSAVAQQEYRLRVTVNLVQVDATVTDSKGDPVPDLTAADFRILLDGKPQELKYCNFIRLGDVPRLSPLDTAPTTNSKTTAAVLPAMPASGIKRGDVRRTIVLFVGDLLTSAESMPGIRAGLKQFVQEQLQPGDLVAIIRSSAGLGALQDFTPDKRMLLAAIDKVGWTSNAVGLGGVSAYEQILQHPKAATVAPDLTQLDNIDLVERGTLQTTASLLKVVRGMADLPGRKSVVLISDALRLTSPDELNPMTGKTDVGTGAFLGPIYQSMRDLADESVRAGVVLYAIDTRGLTSLRALASDRLYHEPGPAPAANLSGVANTAASADSSPARDWVTSATADRRSEYRDNQWGAMYLASQTGGFMITESNRIDSGLARIMADQRGYYLLGFQPPAETMHPDDKNPMAFAAPQAKLIFHQLKIELVRPGFKVRSHAGFFGVADEARSETPHAELQLSQSLESPFQSSGIDLDVDASFLSAKNRYFIRATLYIDGNDVVFSGPPVHRTGVVHVILRAFNATGDTLRGGIDQMRRIDLNEEGYQRARKFGLIYTTLLPVPKPGPYQVRAACQDVATGKIGTGGDFVSIPQPKGNGLRMSGIVFQHALGTDDHVVPATGPSVYSAGQSARFAFEIASNGPQPKIAALEIRTRLFRDGLEVWKSAAMPLEADATKTLGIFASGSLDVPQGLDPGNYLVRVDLGEKTRPDVVSAWQWAKVTLR